MKSISAIIAIPIDIVSFLIILTLPTSIFGFECQTFYNLLQGLIVPSLSKFFPSSHLQLKLSKLLLS
jgi:hypothetical protein